MCSKNLTENISKLSDLDSDNFDNFGNKTLHSIFCGKVYIARSTDGDICYYFKHLVQFLECPEDKALKFLEFKLNTEKDLSEDMVRSMKTVFHPLLINCDEESSINQLDLSPENKFDYFLNTEALISFLRFCLYNHVFSKYQIDAILAAQKI